MICVGKLLDGEYMLKETESKIHKANPFILEWSIYDGPLVSTPHN